MRFRVYIPDLDEWPREQHNTLETLSLQYGEIAITPGVRAGVKGCVAFWDAPDGTTGFVTEGGRVGYTTNEVRHG